MRSCNPLATATFTTPGLINLDFADVKSVMAGAGSALMGIGTARGDDRAVAAAEAAISSPLLEASIDGAHGVLLSIQGGSDLGLFEINEAAQLVANSAAPDANIIFGAVIDDALGDEVRVTVIAAGFDELDGSRPRPRTTSYPASSAASTGSASTASRNPVSASTMSSSTGPASSPLPALTSYAPPVTPPARAPEWRSFSIDDQQSEPAPAPKAESDHATEPGDAAGEPVKIDGVPAPRPGSSDGKQAGRPAINGSGTRRKSVVFEEDDELDVPDFLK